MRAPLRFILLLWCSPALSSVRAQLPRSADSTGAFFARLSAHLTGAATRGDTAAYRRLIDPAAVFISDDGSRESADEHVRNIPSRGDELARSRYDLDSVRVYLRGGMAFVDFRVLQHQLVGPRDFTYPYRVLNTYVRRGAHWLLLRHAETHSLVLPPPQALDASLLDEYVGRYEWWPGYVDVIWRNGNQLFNQATGDAKASLNQAATPEAFYIAGDPSVVVFTRDKTGRVDGYVLNRPDGQVTRARKLP